MICGWGVHGRHRSHGGDGRWSMDSKMREKRE
jgi:hypothetical protein